MSRCCGHICTSAEVLGNLWDFHPHSLVILPFLVILAVLSCMYEWVLWVYLWDFHLHSLVILLPLFWLEWVLWVCISGYDLTCQISIPQLGESDLAWVDSWCIRSYMNFYLDKSRDLACSWYGLRIICPLNQSGVAQWLSGGVIEWLLSNFLDHETLTQLRRWKSYNGTPPLKKGFCDMCKIKNRGHTDIV